ncbi:hypothetical protein [Dysgonomonas sp. ZJ709]|uniref:hypothetical protein n=1 Tax=Dysgonomonas sp. ZJ709 TaxID=2709797 RepID=UPI0013EC11C9|nr:hypothetical protein [Dysgonomonas sp. ZJ709]
MNENADIREGNWVNDKNEGLTEVNLQYLKDIANELTTFKPIWLNESILLKNGFEKKGNDDGMLMFHKSCVISPTSIYTGKLKEYPLFIFNYKPNEPYTNSYYLSPGNYLITLHQLQNIYQDLTGFDLVVDRNDIIL